MKIDQFWSIVDAVHQKSGGDMDKKCELLRERLVQLNTEGIRGFRSHFDACNHRAYDWSLWGAAYIIHGGCSDDSFSDFRSSLISRGRSLFERALADPDSLADVPLTEEDACYEGYAYVVTDAEKEILGDSPQIVAPFPTAPSGEPWSEDDIAALAQRFPRLHRKYSSSSGDDGAGPNPKKPWWKLW